MHNAIVVLQPDPTHAENLGSSFKSVSEAVFVVQSLLELQALVAQFPISIGVVDLGLVTVEEVVGLRNHGMQIVCTHRTPDDTMWTEAMDAGALDCCFNDDVPAICRAIQQMRQTALQSRSDGIH
jgi:hypothetical protein